MSKFKVGDKVRRKSGGSFITSSFHLKIGDVGTVSLVRGQNWIGLEEFQCAHDRAPFDRYHFELVSESSELEDLVRTANAGLDAFNKLYLHYPDKTEGYFPSSGRVADEHWQFTNGQGNSSLRFRIKPTAPVFPPLRVGSWEVTMSDKDTVKIGCQTFDARGLMFSLQALCSGGANESSGLVGSRIGVAQSGVTKHSISWADADKLLAALEEYSKESK